MVPAATAAKAAGGVKSAGIGHFLGWSVLKVLLIPFTVIVLALAFLLFAGEVKDSSEPELIRARAGRRRFLLAARNLALPVFLTAAAALLLIVGVAREYRQIARKSVTIAAGRPDTEAYRLIQTLKTISARAPARIDLTLLAAGNDSENLQRLGSGDAQLAVAGSGIPPVPAARRVAVLYRNVFHLLVQKDSAAAEFADLKGKVIGVPQTGDDYASFLAIAKYYGLDDKDFRFVGGDQDSADAAFAHHDAEAVFRVRPASSPYIKRIVITTGAKLLPLGNAAALKVLVPGYETAAIPVGLYRVDPPEPAVDTPTLADRRVLYAHKDLDPETVFSLADILFQRRAEVSAALGGDAQDLRRLAANVSKPPATGFDAPIHPGVDAFNRANQDPFLRRRMATLLFLIFGVILCAAAALEWRRLRRRKRQFQPDWYKARLGQLTDVHDVVARRKDLDLLQLDAIYALKRDRISPEEFAAFEYAWSSAMQSANNPG